ncbi:MAG: lysophospholipid acyltransferase family protein [Desulfoplanes sp.]|nr:lysophospholipid acyltransferase family protein [Desulfoplanes sp.]
MQLYHLAPLLTGLFRLWGRTLRFTRINYQAMTSREAKGESLIFAIWHDELFAPTYLHRDEGIVAVVSSSKDGEILARVMQRLGYGLARGSSSRQGLKAMLCAMKEVRSHGRHVVLTVDGPRGPRHEAKAGAIYLASKANVPLIPVRIRISRAKIFYKAWDRFQLPFPGARCEIIYGEPYHVPEKLDGATLKKEQERLTRALNDLA